VGGGWSAAISTEYDSCAESCTSSYGSDDDWISASPKSAAVCKPTLTYRGAKSLPGQVLSFSCKFWRDADTQMFPRRHLEDPDRPGLCGPGQWSSPSQIQRAAQLSRNPLQLLDRIKRVTDIQELEYFTHVHVADVHADTTHPFTLDLQEYRFFQHHESRSGTLVVNEIAAYQIYTSNAMDGQPQDK